MRIFVAILLFCVLLASCNRRVRIKDIRHSHTESSDSTVEKISFQKVPISIPADSASLAFTVHTVKDELTGRTTIVPGSFSTQKGRAKGTTTIDELGNIFTKIHCEGLEEELQIAVKEKERYKRMYESQSSENNKEVTIIKYPWWLYPLIGISIILLAFIIYTKLFKPLIFRYNEIRN